MTIALLVQRTSASGQTHWSFAEHQDEKQPQKLQDDCGEALHSGLALERSDELGRYVVATRAYRCGEVVIEERPLIDAQNDTGESEDWAEPRLRAFCAASAELQAEVLKMHSGAGNEPNSRMQNDVATQVRRCAGALWREGVSDATLEKVCLIFLLNAYPVGADSSRVALFALCSKVAHSCVANLAYSPCEIDATPAGSVSAGSMTAKRDIVAGETLSTNYLGDASKHMSTPARREALLGASACRDSLTSDGLPSSLCLCLLLTACRLTPLADSKLFSCMCPRCADLGEDTLRRIPCAKCHPRGADGLLPDAVAFGRERTLSDGTAFRVRYAAPRRSALAATSAHTWHCSHCASVSDDVAILPSGRGTRGLSGRASEQQVEQYVHGLDQLCSSTLSTGGASLRLAEGDMLYQQMKMLDGLVSRRVGAQHWASVRLRALMEKARA